MKVIISAGGTGGHIYPAIAIINKIKEEEPKSEILYIGTSDRMEKDLIPELGIKYQPITVSGLKRKLTFDNVKVLYQFLKARNECKKIIKDFNPDVVIGAGGYVTGPVIWAAKKTGKKTFIHEQNSVVGLSNKYLSKYADKIGVSFESTLSCFPKDKVVLTGNPCSEKAISMKKAKKEDYGLDKNKKLVLIVMGSLGSKTVNDKIVSFLESFKNKDYQVLFVTGNSYYEKVKKLRVPSNVKVEPFIYELPSLMKATDLVVTRAGASTMSEILALNIPSIFIPSPYVTNNHQYKNAMDLVNKNAGLILEEKDLTKDNLINLIDKTLSDKEQYAKIKNNLKELGIKDSSSRIYEVLKEMIIDDKKFF
jgi:UDP-N-acetylglucosamine--N-acetylmuramyl-(pentapeptide) pyrophosphoryl-undecaprenol N-acetylglucosamine transferase